MTNPDKDDRALSMNKVLGYLYSNYKFMSSKKVIDLNVLVEAIFSGELDIETTLATSLDPIDRSTDIVTISECADDK